MTYPPQPGQPYGQQPGGYPPQGQFPAGGQPGGYPPGAGFPQAGPPGYGPPPPKKRNPGLWAGLSAAAVAVIAFVITAFVAPGFLLGDDEEGGGNPIPGAQGGTGNQAGGATAFAQQIIDGFNNGDQAALQALKCDDAGPGIDQVIGMAAQVDQAALGPVQESGNSATAQATITADGQEMSSTAELTKNGKSWCWQSVTTGEPAAEPPGGQDEPSAGAEEPAPAGSAGKPGEPAPDAVNQRIGEFVTALNSGNADKAKSMLCYAHRERNVDSMIEDKPELKPEPAIVARSGSAYSAELGGRLDGNEVSSGQVVVANERQDHCVVGFSALERVG